MGNFEEELRELLNRYSMENDSDTPDFILANYLSRCLDNWNQTMTERENWYAEPMPETVIQSSLDAGTGTGVPE